MAYTEADLTAIQNARRRGVRTVQIGDRSTTYASDAEMRQLESDIRRDLGLATGRPRQIQLVGSKGLGCF